MENIIVFLLICFFIGYAIIKLFSKKQPQKNVQKRTATENVSVKSTIYFQNADGTISFSVKGISFKDKATVDAIKSMHVGDSLYLQEEPENIYDSNAIAVYSRNDIHIGYVPKEMTFEFRTVSGELELWLGKITKITSDEFPFVNVKFEKA